MSSLDFYALLGIGPDASQGEIKRAYYRKVKKHTPESDPGMFQLVREAFETLSDERRRSEYDAIQQYGGQIVDLIEEATEALENDFPEDAILLLKQAIALNPHSEASWSMLGTAYLRLEAYNDAKKVYTRLVRDHPDSANYHAYLGVCLLEGGHPEAARASLHQAHQLEPYNAMFCLLVSRTYRIEQRWQEAIEWAEKAIGADGKEDIQDFDAIVELATIYALCGMIEEIDTLSDRATAILKNDSDAREYGAMRFAALGAEFLRSKAYEAARACFEAGVRLAPGNLELREAANNIREVAMAITEYRRIENDAAIIPPLRTIVGCRVYLLLDIADRHHLDHLILEAANNLYRWPPNEIERSIRRLREYPTCYGMAQDLLEMLCQPVRSGRPRPDNTASGQADKSCLSCGGCLLWFVIGHVVYAILSK